MNKLLQRSLIGLGITVALVGTTSAAYAATGTSTPAFTPPSATTQVQDAQSVQSFKTAHVAPTKAASESYAQFNAAVEAYWQQVPWQAVLGASGCTARDISVSTQTGGDGVSRPILTLVTHCAGTAESASASALRAIDGTATSSTAPANAFSVETAAASATPAAADSSGSYCAHKSSSYLCIYFNTSSNIIGATAEWEGSSATTGHVRLGQLSPASSCADGTLVVNSPTSTLEPGDQVQALSTWDEDTNWSSTFYNPSKYGQYCHVA